jgi:hypothetical protein
MKSVVTLPKAGPLGQDAREPIRIEARARRNRLNPPVFVQTSEAKQELLPCPAADGVRKAGAASVIASAPRRLP